jgi:cell wall-associated NlpC family hydrolase
MTRIEPSQWLPATFARALTLADVLRHPTGDCSTLNADDKDRLRQTQVESGEAVRILGFHERYALIMKADHVIGWVEQRTLAVDADVKNFAPPASARLSAGIFFDYWAGTPYIWGGITRAGIDCSGLTQRYYRDVLERSIPKNSHDQRRAGTGKELSDVANHDLVFCTRIGGRGIHHVGIYLDGGIWHAHGERGVIRQALDEFLSHYQVLEIVIFGK